MKKLLAVLLCSVLVSSAFAAGQNAVSQKDVRNALTRATEGVSQVNPLLLRLMTSEATTDCSDSSLTADPLMCLLRRGIKEDPKLAQKFFASVFSEEAKAVYAKYQEALSVYEFTQTKPYDYRSIDNTVTPKIRELMKAHNAFAAQKSAEANALAWVIMQNQADFDIPALIDQYSLDWGDAKDLDAYAAYLKKFVKK